MILQSKRQLFCIIFGLNCLFSILHVRGKNQKYTGLDQTDGNVTNEITRECVLSKMSQIDCRNAIYPAIDGTCNNPLNPYAGAAKTPYKRLLPPSYDDGFETFRRSISGRELPATRLVSNIMNDGDSNLLSNVVNAMFVQFGQYLTHDIASTPMLKKDESGNKLNCGCLSPHPSCINVPIAFNDPFYNHNTRCIPLEGSQIAKGCNQLPREQTNSLTAFIDAGTIYGASEELLQALREPHSDYGALRLVNNEQEEEEARGSFSSGCPMRRQRRLLPTLGDVEPAIAKMFACKPDLKSPACFVSGEDRVNENIGLAASHMIFTREHNRIAKRLKTINHHWDSDKVFHETRRILMAVHQKITYSEFLPLLLGPKFMKEFDLRIVNNGFYHGYDATYDATVSNAFTTAAFRYGHSQVGSFYNRPGPDYVTEQHSSIRVFKGLFQQEAVLNGTSSSIMRGLMVDPAKLTDPKFVEDLRNRMFESETKVGQDLLAINIQRGREHGLPPYNDFREFCGLPRANEWNDLLGVMPISTVEKLQRVYRSVDDVDLYMGGIAERSVMQGNVGPTFGCIIGYQFRDMRKGDRFWFENPEQFNSAQLRELQKVTFSRILCDNLEGMETVPPNAMQLESESNSRVSCSQLPKMNIDSWKEFSYRQDGTWSRWFPAQHMPATSVLQKIITLYSDSVCLNPLDVEIQPISEDRKDLIKVRYLCPIGSIQSNAFPNAKQNLNYYWTVWFDRDSPTRLDGNDDESLEHLKVERANDVCGRPLYMQAQTKEGESAYDSDEVFVTLSSRHGLFCRGSDQPTGRCKDYRVRFYCPKDYRENIMYYNHDLQEDDVGGYPKNSWTQWINLGNPRSAQSGNYDLETLSFARQRLYNVCRRPLLIEGRVASTKVPAEKSGDVLKRYSVYHGLICDNRDQLSGVCHDYEVRYLCPSSTLRNRN